MVNPKNSRILKKFHNFAVVNLITECGGGVASLLFSDFLFLLQNILEIQIFSLLLHCFPLRIVDGGAITSSSAGMVG